MPAEASRFTRRLGARDRRFFAALACAGAAAVPAAVLLQGGKAAPAGTCVSAVRASIMGGATYRWCGAAATARCKVALAAGETDLIGQCRRRVAGS